MLLATSLATGITAVIVFCCQFQSEFLSVTRAVLTRSLGVKRLPSRFFLPLFILFVCVLLATDMASGTAVFIVCFAPFQCEVITVDSCSLDPLAQSQVSSLPVLSVA